MLKLSDVTARPESLAATARTVTPPPAAEEHFTKNVALVATPSPENGTLVTAAQVAVKENVHKPPPCALKLNVKLTPELGAVASVSVNGVSGTSSLSTAPPTNGAESVGTASWTLKPPDVAATLESLAATARTVTPPPAAEVHFTKNVALVVTPLPENGTLVTAAQVVVKENVHEPPCALKLNV